MALRETSTKRITNLHMCKQASKQVTRDSWANLTFSNIVNPLFFFMSNAISRGKTTLLGFPSGAIVRQKVVKNGRGQCVCILFVPRN